MSEPLGANTLLHGHLAESSSPITISLPGVHSIAKKGQKQRFSIDPSQLHVFDPDTGKRLNA